MVTRTNSAGRVRLAAALVGALVFGAGAKTEGSDLSVTLSPQSGEGLIKYAGGSSALDGEKIGVDSVTGLNTPNNGPSTKLPVVHGSLSFNTGAFLGGDASGTQWDFAGGGHVTVEGTIPSLGINTEKVLLTGAFSDPSFVKSLNNGGGLKVQGGAFFSVVDPTLAAYFGLPTGGVLYSGGLSTLFKAEGTSPNAFSSNGFTGGTLTVSPVPEPGMLVVFGSLAVGGAAWVRRRRA